MISKSKIKTERFCFMNFFKKAKTPKGTFLLGCLVGGLVFICIFGFSVVDVTNVGWLYDSSSTEGLWDLTQHYLGWVYYRKSPWAFPLGLMQGLNTSAVSVVYTDSIPLFAVIFKCLSPLLPETFQYFGLFELMSYILMGGFGALFLRRFTDDLISCQASALLFSISPCMLKRVFYHSALSAHFLVVAAICLWVWRDILLEKRNGKRGYLRFLWTLLICVASAINAYFVPMVLGIMLCGLLQELLEKKIKIKKIVADIACPVFSMGLLCYILGYFYGDVSASTTGLENLSFNLLQFFNPGNDLCVIDHRNYIFSTQNYSSFLSTLPTISGWQEEGFSYLGLGMILLGIAVIIGGVLHGKSVGVNMSQDSMLGEASETSQDSMLGEASETTQDPMLGENSEKCQDSKSGQASWSTPQGIARKRKSWIISISLGMLVFLFLALSPTATAGSLQMYHISYPGIIYKALSVFRSCGRLIWPVYYGTMGLLLYSYCKFFAAGTGNLTTSPTKFAEGDTVTKKDTAAKKDTVTKKHILPQKNIAARVLLILLIVLQIYDIWPGLAYKKSAYALASADDYADEATTYKKYLTDDIWEELAKTKSRIVFCPPTEFGIECDPQVSCVFEEYALCNDMDLNVTYMSRDMSSIADEQTKAELESRKNGASYPDTIYIFFDISNIPDAKEVGLTYCEADGFVVGYE